MRTAGVAFCHLKFKGLGLRIFKEIEIRCGKTAERIPRIFREVRSGKNPFQKLELIEAPVPEVRIGLPGQILFADGHALRKIGRAGKTDDDPAFFQKLPVDRSLSRHADGRVVHDPDSEARKEGSARVVPGVADARKLRGCRL